MIHVLYFYTSNFRSMCAVPSKAVFCRSLMSCYPDVCFRYFLNDFGVVPVAPIITGITFVFTFQIRSIPIVNYLYFKKFGFIIIIIIIVIIIAFDTDLFVASLFSLNGPRLS
jgi:hypothetical protein